MSELVLGDYLELDRCPHCSVKRPTLTFVAETQSKDRIRRLWRMYQCTFCGGVVLAASLQAGMSVVSYWPRNELVSKELPTRARSYLQQALDCLHSPAASIMCAASAIDAMLKDKGLVDGSLYKRIDEAKAKGMITEAMAEWAHEVRMDANDERHVDWDSAEATADDAKRVVEFTQAFAEYLFVLPARVTLGRQSSRNKQIT